MTVDRGRLNWGVFFIGLSLLPLAVNAGVLDRSFAGQVVALWPLVVIALGLGLILRVGRARALGGLLIAATFGLIVGALLADGGGVALAAGCANRSADAGPAVTGSGAFPDHGRVTLEVSCADLTIDRQAGGNWSVSAAQGGGPAPVIEQVGDLLRLDSGSAGFPIQSQRRLWQVDLPTAPLGTVYVTTNASSAHILLGGAPVLLFGGTFNASDARIDLASADMSNGPLNLTLNASSGTLLLPSTGTGAASTITLNASSLKICAPAGLGLRIPYSGALSSDNLGSAGLTLVGNAWQTPGYDAATTRMELRLSTNVSSTTLDRSGECP